VSILWGKRCVVVLLVGAMISCAGKKRDFADGPMAAEDARDFGPETPEVESAGENPPATDMSQRPGGSVDAQGPETSEGASGKSSGGDGAGAMTSPSDQTPGESPAASEPAGADEAIPVDPGDDQTPPGTGASGEQPSEPSPSEPAPSTPPPSTPPPSTPPSLPPELLANGAICTLNDECSSNLCSDSRCCQASCGACEACLGASGTCLPVVDAVDPDSCAAPRLCGASGVCLTIDQTQAVANINVTLAGLGVSRFAQIVLPARSGALREISLAVSCFSGAATFELQGVSNGEPDNIVQFRRSFLTDNASSATRVLIEPPLTVRAGFPFSIVLGATSIDQGCAVSGSDAETYTRGDAFIEDPRAPGQWFSFDGDLQFETRVAQ
jgi:hypothetical protein